jgi:hypothetical protein
MGSIIYDNFSGGLDLRKLQAMGPANALFKLSNAYITTGKTIKKRPCLTRVANLEAGTKGLRAAGGKLNTFYESGTITHADGRFVANKVTHPTVTPQNVTKVHYGENFNGFLYCAVEYADGSIRHHYLDGVGATAVADVNCPHGRSVRKIGQKLYCPPLVSGLVRYCKTGDPQDWTTASDAGFINAGIQAAGSDEVTAVGEYQSGLAITFSDSMQLWTIDADPTANSTKANAAIGTIHPKTPTSFAGDLVLLSAMGFRTVSLTALTNNLQENDLGSPIDALRPEFTDDDDPISVFYPKLGQLWIINRTKCYVYSFSKTSKLSAWSTFTLPVSIQDAAVLLNDLYLRSGDVVYVVDSSVYSDDGVIPIVEVEMFYQDAKQSGVLKQFYGFDGVGTGSPSIAFKFNTNDANDVTDYVEIDGDMRPGSMVPVEVCSTSIAPILRHEKNESFELQAMQLYFHALGAV